MPRFSSSRLNWLLPRQVTYCVPLSVRISCRHAVGGDGGAEHLDHQRRRLAGVQAVAGDEAAVVVHEGHQVDAAVLPLEHEGEQIGLPELVRPGPLEGADRSGADCGSALPPSRSPPHAARGPRLAGLAGKAGPRTSMSLIRWQPQSGWACLSIRIVRLVSSGRRLPALTPRGCFHQAGRTQLLEALLPGIERVPRDVHQRAEVARRQAAPLPRVQQQQLLRWREGSASASRTAWRACRGSVARDGAWAVPLPKPDRRRTARAPPLLKIGTLRRALRRLRIGSATGAAGGTSDGSPTSSLGDDRVDFGCSDEIRRGRSLGRRLLAVVG